MILVVGLLHIFDIIWIIILLNFSRNSYEVWDALNFLDPNSADL